MRDEMSARGKGVKDPLALAGARDAIITVGEGRGFLVENPPWSHRVITAAHCLPHLPPPHAASYTEERTYQNLLGPLGAAPTVGAECIFVDPIADLAVLEQPDDQALYDEAEAYERFMDGRPTVRIGRVRKPRSAWLLTPDGQWERCTVQAQGGRYLVLGNPKEGNAPGTSGSPILTADARAVGVVSIRTKDVGKEAVLQWGQPELVSCLPARLLTELLNANGRRI